MYSNEDLMLLANLAITMITPCSIVSYLAPDINFILWRARSSHVAKRFLQCIC